MESNKEKIDIKENQIEDKTKTCFIITPIGDENTIIRRHIDGMIDGVISPVLECKGYKMEVAHRISSPGSINKQVISKIYSSDLVIANLTDLNANVMYELAFRHATRKPVIMIMEKGEKQLPFDVNNERTIFYKNDFQGAVDLKDRILNAIDAIESDYKDVDNPIYTALESIQEKETVLKSINKSTGVNTDALKYIIEKLDYLERSLFMNKYNRLNNIESHKKYIVMVDIEDYSNWDVTERQNFIKNLMDESFKFKEIAEVSRITGLPKLAIHCISKEMPLSDIICYFHDLIEAVFEKLKIDRKFNLDATEMI